MRKFDQFTSSLATNIIGAIILLLVLFGAIVSSIGYISFTNAFEKEYSQTTYHIGDTAASMINGDHLDSYLAGQRKEEYEETKERLDSYCHRMHITMLYVIKVDRSDYGRFVSIFNPIDNSVDDTHYTEWELGHKRDTTNAEYRRKYRALYELRADYETVYRTKPTDGQNPHITTLVPIKTESGVVSAILCVQRPIRELDDARRPYLTDIFITGLAMAALASLFAVYHIRKHFVGPIEKLSAEASRFAAENTRGEPLGSISMIQEIADLAESIDTMEEDMEKYIENLTAVTAEKERIGAELSLARTIQKNSIPNVFPAFPDRTDFDIYASMTPAREVGGDFYNFILIDEDHLAMMIGDVSGKGIPAALFMMVSNSLIMNRTTVGGTPAEILASVNDYICERNHADMFVTLWLGILDLKTGRITASNAGHEYPALKRGGRFELLQDRHGVVIGGMAGLRYRDYDFELKPGDKLFLYTDGVPEATDGEDHLFGSARMLQALNAAPDAAPEQTLKTVQAAVDDFVRGAEQFDDLTMLCVEYKGK